MIPLTIPLFAVQKDKANSYIWGVVGFEETSRIPMCVAIGGPLTIPMAYTQATKERHGELVTFPTYEAAEAYRDTVRLKCRNDVRDLITETEAHLRQVAS